VIDWLGILGLGYQINTKSLTNWPLYLNRVMRGGMVK